MVPCKWVRAVGSVFEEDSAVFAAESLIDHAFWPFVRRTP
jgi:hypothetical protein